MNGSDTKNVKTIKDISIETWKKLKDAFDYPSSSDWETIGIKNRAFSHPKKSRFGFTQKSQNFGYFEYGFSI